MGAVTARTYHPQLQPEDCVTTSDRPSPFSPQLHESMRAFVCAYMSAATTMLERARTAFQPLLDEVKTHPELLEQWRLEREAEARITSCHCLCGGVHPSSEGVCAGTAEPGLTVTFHSQTVGTQHVAFCRSCYDARQAELVVGVDA